MALIDYASLFVILFAAEVIYIRAARRWGLIDKPNGRSLHTDRTTVRGGGVIFWLAALSVFAYGGDTLSWFFIGLTLVAAVSFLDDVRPVPKRYRLIMQFAGCCLALIPSGILPDQWWLFIGILLTGMALLNAYNFMDGINGMTAFYSLVTVGTLWYWFTSLPIPEGGSRFITETSLLFPPVFMALLVFAFFNARQQAVCFAGDVGSVSMGFIIGYCLLSLIWVTQSFLPLTLLTVYSLDTGLTIGERLWLKQTIFQPHRQHLFQVLVQRNKWSHLRVAGLYAILQSGINILILLASGWQATDQWLLSGGIVGVMTITYGIIKWRLVFARRNVDL